ncbi:hypothetical protein Fmac_027411 [Flemingia macrophylla]|uniref:Transposase, Ptta/En/Spm, plant n=1 Tax=Flemingia macrophylla TaxID=520843 RepID=A0ABD1LHP2_9FABA
MDQDCIESEICLFSSTLDVNGVLVLDAIVNGPTWESCITLEINYDACYFAMCLTITQTFPLVVEMSTAGNNDIPEPSSPLAKKRRKGTMKGKQPKYVIKLPPLKKAPVVESPLIQPSPSEVENIVPIPSQPLVVEPTPYQPSIVQPMPSQPPIVQPIQPHINQPMPSQPLPSSMGSHCAAPRRTSLSSPSEHNASPISIPSRVNQNVPEVEQQTSTEAGEPSTYVDDDPHVGAVLEIIEPCNDGFYPSRVASQAITKTIKQQYVQPWPTWGAMSDEEKNVFFQRFKATISEAASCGGGEDISPLDPVEEEKLRNKSWLVAAGGKNPKGRVYGVGKLNQGYICGDTFPQQTSSFAAADSQKIIRLEEEVRQSREEVRQSREENQRLQKKLQSLVSVVLPLLPPAAQIILQDLDEQQQNDDQNQDAQEDDQHHAENSPPHYADY